MYQRQLSFMEAIKKVYLQNYCNFEGRASRSEFWWSYLGQQIIFTALYIVLLIISIIVGIISAANDSSIETTLAVTYIIVYIPLLIVGLALFLPSLGVQIRRMHDIGKSGWWILLSFIPLIGTILMIIWLASESEMNDNEYGPVPNIEPNPWSNTGNGYNTPAIK